MDISGFTAHRAAASAAITLALSVGTVVATTAPASAAPGVRAAVPAASAATAAVPDATSYADALVRAWGAGDRRRAAGYATPSVTTALFTYASPGGGLWRRTGSDGAAGTVYVSYRYGSTERTVTIGVSNIGLGSGAGHDAYRVSFG